MKKRARYVLLAIFFVYCAALMYLVFLAADLEHSIRIRIILNILLISFHLKLLRTT